MTFDRIKAPGVLLAALALLILGAACGSEPVEPTAEPAPVDTAAPQATAPPAPAPTTPPTETPAPRAGESTPEAGIAVGNLALDFTLRLVDGSDLTSAQLREEGRPVFLFFLAGW